MKKIITFIRLLFFIRRWKKINTENKTYPGTLFDQNRVEVGKYTYGQLNIRMYGTTDSKLFIGKFCSIADNTYFLLDGEHNFHCVSTYPFKQDILRLGNESFGKGNIIVSDDVWIGYGATILSGVHIDQGVVVATGAVVTKDVPPYAVVGGVPAKVIKYRFEQPVIDYMLTLDYDALTEDLIREHVDDLYTEIDGMELEEVKKLFAWFPKKSSGMLQ